MSMKALSDNEKQKGKLPSTDSFLFRYNVTKKFFRTCTKISFTTAKICYNGIISEMIISRWQKWIRIRFAVSY